MTSLNSPSLVSAEVRAQLETTEHLQLQQHLGAGTYAHVRQAFSTTYGVTVAVKIIDRRRAKADYVSHFLPRELALIPRLRHPNIIRLLKIIDTPHIVCIVTELAANGDLLTRIRDQTRLDEKTSKRMFRQLVEALHYLHDMNIAHRDLKCENVLLDKWDNIKVADFGFAREMDTVSKTFCGSRAYAPPEILQAHAYNHCKVDLWSMGVILYIMNTGSMPFSEKNHQRTLKQQLLRDLHYPTRAKDLSAECRGLIRALLHPDANHRPTYAQQCADPWLAGVVWEYKHNNVVYTLSPGANTTSAAPAAAPTPGHSPASTSVRSGSRSRAGRSPRSPSRTRPQIVGNRAASTSKSPGRRKPAKSPTVKTKTAARSKEKAK